MPQTWKDKDDEPVRFNRKAQAWLRRNIRSTIFAPSTDDPEFPFESKHDGVLWNATVVNWLLDWYLERPLRYVRWEDATEWRGRGFSSGAWVYVETAVLTDRKEGVAVVDKRIDESHCATLDEWLRADIAGELLYAGAPSGMERVTTENRAPSKRRCECGARFLPSRRNGRRCCACVLKAREERKQRSAP
jgi:hypothetical protein